MPTTNPKPTQVTAMTATVVRVWRGVKPRLRSAAKSVRRWRTGLDDGVGDDGGGQQGEEGGEHGGETVDLIQVCHLGERFGSQDLEGGPETAGYVAGVGPGGQVQRRLPEPLVDPDLCERLGGECHRGGEGLAVGARA